MGYTVKSLKLLNDLLRQEKILIRFMETVTIADILSVLLKESPNYPKNKEFIDLLIILITKLSSFKLGLTKLKFHATLNTLDLFKMIFLEGADPNLKARLLSLSILQELLKETKSSIFNFDNAQKLTTKYLRQLLVMCSPPEAKNEFAMSSSVICDNVVYTTPKFNSFIENIDQNEAEFFVREFVKMEKAAQEGTMLKRSMLAMFEALKKSHKNKKLLKQIQKQY